MMEFFEANKDILLFTGAAAVKALAFLGAVMGFTALMTLAERKVSALMQDRVGPNRASVFGFAFNGLFQPIADAIKMILKEDFVPGRAEKLLFTLAPFFALVPVLALFAVIPFGDYVMVYGYQLELQIADLPLGLFFVLALSGLAIYGVFLGGWASKNNFALLGGLRGAAQMVSYEVVLGLTLVGLMMIYGSASLQDMVRAQGRLLFGFIPAWGVVCQPFAFILFLIASTAENKRTPFDLVEGESEIIGYFMEYSSMRFAAFMFAEFIEIVLISMLIATLFFGGWQVPYLYETGFMFPGGAELPLNHYLVSAMQVGSFTVKTVFFCWFSLIVRWTLPRFRFDQMMSLCWKALLPLALLNILLTGAAMTFLGKL
ncbi:MAG: NADH-quinone oxidoreductase subunit NuoH [Elusimicrobiales bacterium]|nr:NADH-quinone oxidoreductase subunit NuoH [Elusimicrobiales bacterium]